MRLVSNIYFLISSFNKNFAYLRINLFIYLILRILTKEEENSLLRMFISNNALYNNSVID